MPIQVVVAGREGRTVHLNREHRLCFLANDDHDAEIAVEALNAVAVEQRTLLRDMALQWAEKYKSQKSSREADVLTEFARVIQILDENDRPPCGL